MLGRSHKKRTWVVLGCCGCALLAGVAVAQQATRTRTSEDTGGAARDRQNATNAGGADRFLASCLLAKNQSEIEMGELALETTQNRQVRDLAQMLVDDHGEAVQKLQQLTSENQRSGDEIDRLISIDKAINEQVTSTMAEKLRQKSGAEFDECFVNAQVAGHQHMSAALAVIQEQTSGLLAQLAQELKPTVDKHLMHAEQLAEQAKSQKKQANRTEAGRSAR